jgi:DNA replication protein DnaC
MAETERIVIAAQARASTLRYPTSDELPPGPQSDPVDAQAAEQRWRRAIPRRFWTARIDQLSPPLDIVAGWDLQANVLLVGNVGSGKTHAAVAAGRMAHDQGKTVMFVPVVELLDQLRPDGDPKVLDRALAADVLILDDVGLEKPSDWTGERLYAIVNRRWLEQRPTIVTSNLTPDELERSVGRPMWSRLYDSAKRVTVGGQDRRKAA